jgi:hypothetical protein
MKILKSALSLLLAMIMIFSCCSVAMAAKTEESDVYPQILVTGFGSGCVKIYYEDDPEQKSLFWPFETERFIKNLGNIGKYIKKSLKEKNPDILHSIIYNYVMDCFGMLALNPDGTSMDGVVTEPVGVRYASEGKYEFYYDCRVSPLVTADYLHESIQQVLEETGAEKVELVGSSHGANMVTAYMYKYPEELSKVDTVLQCVPSVGGIRFMGELFSGNFDINALALCDFIDRLAGEGVIPDFFYLMEEAGVLGLFLDVLAEPVLKKAVYEAIADVGRDFIATLPAMWVSVPDAYFVDAMKFLYGENYNDPGQEYADLIEEMNFYHYEIANKAADIYVQAEKDNEDFNMALITKFGIAAIPFGTAENIMDDGLVTVPISSFGATCTTYKSKLPADYKQAKYTEYNFMSPEWNIDASTGAFPFRTWYIKGLEHTQKNADYFVLIDEIVNRDLTVFTDPEIPQYLTVSAEDPEKIEPLVAEEEKDTLYDKIFAILRTIILLPKTIWNKIFSR